MTAPHEPFAGFDQAVSGGRPAPAAEPRADLRTWARDLVMGARFAAGGGRDGWTRTLLTAVGVGLGVALLLLAASVPPMMTVRDHKRVARDAVSGDFVPRPTDRTLLIADAGTTFRGQDISGTLVRPEGPKAEPPPGVDRLPGPGHMVVSPALRRLLAAQPLLRERIPYTDDGLIGHAGLMGPAELYYYAGSDRLTARDASFAHGNATRVTGFGHRSNSEVMGPTFDLLLIVMLVVLLLPVAVFIGTAVRLGGERRDQRLAALRLVGADARTTRRIAAGEALFGALVGLLFGGAFFFAGRQLASHVTIRGISAYPSDMTPQTALTVLVALAVPVAAVAVTMLSLRGTVIEPLGVVRDATGRGRRLWWRLLIPVIGLGLLAPLFGTVKGDAPLNTTQVAVGAVLVLVGVTAVLPWVVERAVGLLRGGPVAWQLATRRLQLNSNAAARMVSGVTVAVAGAIALQMLFTAVGGDFERETGADPARAQVLVSAEVRDADQARQYIRQVTATRGVGQAHGYVSANATQPDAARVGSGDFAYLPVQVGDCAMLRELARLPGCAPGSVFVVPQPEGGDDGGVRRYLRPGARIDLNRPPQQTYTGTPELWTIPGNARPAVSRTDPTGSREWGLLVTPEALGSARLQEPQVHVMASLDQDQPDAVEYVRNTAARLGVGVGVWSLRSVTEKSPYTQLRRGLVAGAAVTMALIGSSLLVMTLEQLRDRRKLLAVLVAFGTRRSALVWSVLWQTAIPVVLGLVLACAGGLGLGAALLAMVGRPFRPDWGAMGLLSAIGAAVVFSVTLLSVPPLWRMMRPDGLRTE
jgi:hypothetical protein